jgi:hypothetical protein
MIPIISIIENKEMWPNFGIDQKLEKILEEKSDLGLEKIIKCFEDGTEFIFEDEYL